MTDQVEELKALGVAADCLWSQQSEEEARSVRRQLLALALIRVAHDEYVAIKLEPFARDVFKKETSVILPVASAKVTGLSSEDEELFQALRAERMAIAKTLGVAPYVVFPDTTLIAFAREDPVTENAMLSISGVRVTKLAWYGQRFMANIATG
jgi:ATP-dependent DNA helicase RecQ